MNNSPSKPSQTPGTEKPRTPSDSGWHFNASGRPSNTRKPDNSKFTTYSASVHRTSQDGERVGAGASAVVPQSIVDAVRGGASKAASGARSVVGKARGAATQAADTFAELRARAGGAAAAAKEAWNWTDG